MRKFKNKQKILHKGISVFFLCCLMILPTHDCWGQLEPGGDQLCSVDFTDFLLFVRAFNSEVGDENFQAIMDLNDDSVIDFSDFISFSKAFGSASFIPTVMPEARILQQVSKDPEIEVLFSEKIRIIFTQGLSLKTLYINLESGVVGERQTILQNVSISEDRKSFTATIKSVLADSSLLSWNASCDGGNIRLFDGYTPLAGEAVFSTAFSPADVTLSLRPFSPMDVNQFTPGVYTEASEMVPASGDTLTEETARTALEHFLMARFVNADSVQVGLALFDDAILVSKIANPTLRAGLVSLKGTVAEDAIAAIQRGPFGPIAFGEITSGDYAEVRSGGVVVVDERYGSEAFALFGPVFARVGLQSDTQTGEAEEITGSAILALVAMEQVVVDSSLAQSGTELSRRLNTQMFGRLNSGQASFPGIGIYQTPEGEAFPGGRSFASYAAVFEPLDDVETPATSLLSSYLRRLAPEGTDLPSAGSFHAEVLAFVDRYQDVLSAGELVRVARALKLKE